MASFDFVELLFSKSCKASDVEDIFGTIWPNRSANSVIDAILRAVPVTASNGDVIP